ncbi:pentatricopeptide repeat-containing protein-like [Iris pallida]|uniref:Pentatricopeptide repeat-containing protein-like n=1 Tax=Iris pallida TaxID=29817 RepID=A0AAX6H3U1_IRIPA|nr:pentatricopeptide repeat-containing protein-like [Iris pallida]
MSYPSLSLVLPSNPIPLSISHYNSVIRSHIHSHHPHLALLTFHHTLLLRSAPVPDEFTFPLLFKACATLSALREGAQIHCLLLKSPFVQTNNIYILTSLLNMYLSCGELDDARLLFETMPDKNVVAWNSMVSGLAKSGDMASARGFFDRMPITKNIVSWNALLAGYVRAGMWHEALKLFVELLRVPGLDPNEPTMASLVSAISQLGLLDLARKAHGYVVRKGFSLDGALGVSLIAMYTKCGSIGGAYKVFLSVPAKNVGHWTCMIGGLAAHGLAESALQLFSEMLSDGVRPNYVTFIGVLNACSHEGLAEEGSKYFHLMSESFDIEPGVQHYGCLVDLLGRLGRLEEAMELISNLRTEPGFVVWSTLLSACRKHGNVEIAEVAAKKLFELEPENGSSYVMLSTLYAETGRWEEYRRIRKTMDERGAVKVTGCSWIEVDGKVHQFVAEDMFHVSTQEIYHTLSDLKSNMRCAEFV